MLTKCHQVYKEEPQSMESELRQGLEGWVGVQREQNVTKAQIQN